MTRQFIYSTSLLVCLLTSSLPLHAAGEDGRSWHLGIALGQGQRDNPLISSEDIDIYAVIDFSWYGKRFFFDNGDAGFTFHEQNNIALSFIATFNNERNFYNYLGGRQLSLDTLLSRNLGLGSGLTSGITPDDNTPINTDTAYFLTAETGTSVSPAEASLLNQDTELAERDFALNSGLELLYISPWGDIQAQVLTDVSSTHDGQEAWLSWSHPWYTRNNEFTLTVGAEWKSASLITYYYGVEPDEAFPGRPVYKANSGTNGFIRFSARHAFGEHWQLVGLIEREYLSSAIRNSPIVSANSVDTWFTGFYYSF